MSRRSLTGEHGDNSWLTPFAVSNMVGRGTPPIRLWPLKDGLAVGTYIRRKTQTKLFGETSIVFPEGGSPVREITTVYVPLTPLTGW
jgi:hypothetical protein